MNNVPITTALVFSIVTGVLIYFLAPILTPFLVAGLLGYMFNPAVTGLTRWRLPRSLAVLIVFLLITGLFLGLLLFLIPLIQHQVVRLVQNMPMYLNWIQHEGIPWLERLLGRPLSVDFSSIREMVLANWQDLAEFTRSALTYAASSGMHFVLWFVNLALIPIITFYLLLDWERLLTHVLEFFPPARRGTIRSLARKTDEALGSFLRGQLLVMACLAAIYSIGLWLIGLDLAFAIGLLAGLVSFVPYLGFIVGLAAAGIAAFFEFQDVFILTWVFIVFFAGQLIESYVLTPRLVGRSIGLHPVAIIFSIMAGGQLFGFVGVLLALPAAAALKVWLSYLHQSYISAASAPIKKRGRTREKIL